MIDFYGSGFEIADRMGILDQLRTKHVTIPNLNIVDRDGRKRASFDVQEFRKSVGYRRFNLMRGDLEAILFDTIQNKVPIRFGVDNNSIDCSGDAVHVEYSDGTHQEYELLVGADGIHTRVRALVWGPPAQYKSYLGYSVACSIIERFPTDLHDFWMYSQPNVQVSIYPLRDHQVAFLILFKSKNFSCLSRAEVNRLLITQFRGQGWIVTEVVKQTTLSRQFYFDSVSQITVDPWFQGRIALVGDACQCLSLIAGQGASMAMAWAYLLAEAIGLADGPIKAHFHATRNVCALKLAGFNKKRASLPGHLFQAASLP